VIDDLNMTRPCPLIAPDAGPDGGNARRTFAAAASELIFLAISSGTVPAFAWSDFLGRPAMSLATQLRRGVLALPLLLLFAFLALVASQAPTQALAGTLPVAVPTMPVCKLEPVRAHALWLAQAPADLEAPIRWRQACRA
jgi:hypothetical protein